MTIPDQEISPPDADLGVWVCEGSGILLSPVLFLQSVCPEPYPESLSAGWGRTDTPPKPFRKTRTIPLLYGKCVPIEDCGKSFHLYSTIVPVTRSFEQGSALTDWQIPIRIAGVVLIFDIGSKETSRDPFLRALLPSAGSQNPTLEWVKAQKLPFVVAVLGYTGDRFPEQEFRKQLGLAPETALLSGPSLTALSQHQSDRRRTTAIDNGTFLYNFFVGRKLSFDPDYARRILRSLCRAVRI